MLEAMVVIAQGQQALATSVEFMEIIIKAGEHQEKQFATRCADCDGTELCRDVVTRKSEAAQKVIDAIKAFEAVKKLKPEGERACK